MVCPVCYRPRVRWISSRYCRLNPLGFCYGKGECEPSVCPRCNWRVQRPAHSDEECESFQRFNLVCDALLADEQPPLTWAEVERELDEIMKALNEKRLF